MTAGADRSKQRATDGQDQVFDLDRDDSERPQTIRLDREQLLRDLRETQDLSFERARRGRRPDTQ